MEEIIIWKVLVRECVKLETLKSKLDRKWA